MTDFDGIPQSPPSVSAGMILRAWRSAAGVTQRELASRISWSASAISMAEGDARGRPKDGLKGINDAAASALGLTDIEEVGMRAMSKVSLLNAALDPRMHWAHNYDVDGMAAWAWVRPPEPAEIRIDLWWGSPVQGTKLVEVPANGLLIWFPTSIVNPSLMVNASGPVWVDFGQGVIPTAVAQQLGITMMAGVMFQADAEVRDPPLVEDSRTARLLAGTFLDIQTMAERIGLNWSLIRPHLGAWRSDTPLRVLDRDDLRQYAYPGEIWEDLSSDLHAQVHVSPERRRRVREAAGLSRDGLARRITALDPIDPVTARQIELFESGTLPRVRGLIGRLDTVFGLDGRYGLERTFSAKMPATPGPHTKAKTRPNGLREVEISFPPWWRGPIWLLATAPDRGSTTVMELEWGPWRRRQQIVSDTVLTTRKAHRIQSGRASQDADPLRVRLPSGWSVTAGIGANSKALDINMGWYPVSVWAALRLLRQHVTRLRAATDSSSVMLSGGRPLGQ